MPVSLPDQELRAWLRLSMEPGLSTSTVRNLLAAIGLPQDIYASSGAALARLLPAPMAAQLRREPDDALVQCIEDALVWLQAPGHHLLTLADSAYPPSLLETHDPPLLLYANGNPGLLRQPALAVVGARSATPAGMDNARAFSRHLASQGWCIISGLAQGIDAAAHEGALQAGPQGGGTVAVLGTGIDKVFPAVNRPLAHRIAENGLLITEFPMGARGLKHHFPRRNRIVAGLARGVLVVEAAKHSGSLITARLATEAGREVFAIPGSIHSPLSRGCHALIRQGARLVESGQDILEELGAPRARPSDRQQDDSTSGPASAALPDNAADVLAALGHDPAHVDLLAARTGLDVSALNHTLLELEMSGIVARQHDGRYLRLAKG